MDIKEIIAKRKQKISPELEALLQFFSKKFNDDLAYSTDKARKDFEDILENKKQNTIEKLENIINKIELFAKEKEDTLEKDTEHCETDLKEYLPELKKEIQAFSENKLENFRKETNALQKTCEDAMIYYVEKVKSTKGEKGEIGISGKDGKDGSPDTPDQVVDKVNTSKKKVFMSSISGLFEELSAIKRAINNTRGQKGGGASAGGGMGNTIHETFNVSSATTSITLANKIAGNGTAIFGARYQGQVLDLTTHYTVSGKVITPLISFDDNTVFSISYIRS